MWKVIKPSEGGDIKCVKAKKNYLAKKNYGISFIKFYLCNYTEPQNLHNR